MNSYFFIAEKTDTIMKRDRLIKRPNMAFYFLQKLYFFEGTAYEN